MASCVDVNLILGDETPMVDNTTSVESLDNKGHSIVHGCVNLNHSILDDLHDLGSFINLENLGALIKTGEGHRENNFGDGLIWNTLKIINSLQGAFQENFEVIIIPNSSLDKLSLEERIDLKKTLDLFLAQKC